MFFEVFLFVLFIKKRGLRGGGDFSHSKIILKKKRQRQIRVIMGSSSRDSCHELLKNLEVLPLQSQ